MIAHRHRKSQGTLANARPTLYELPASRGASLGRWLTCAAVAAEVHAEGVLVAARANRVFGSADVTMLVCEWMQAHQVDTVFVRAGTELFSISSRSELPDLRASAGLGQRSRTNRDLVSSIRRIVPDRESSY